MSPFLIGYILGFITVPVLSLVIILIIAHNSTIIQKEEDFYFAKEKEGE